MNYAGMLKLQLTDTQLSRVDSIKRRLQNMIQVSGKLVPSTLKSVQKRACKTVRQCLDKKTCANFHHYFEINNKNCHTRNMGSLIRIPKVKLDFARQSFHFQGAKLYNNMPFEIRNEKTIINFSIY